MSTVIEILEAVKRLPDEQKGDFLDRLREIDFEDDWDRRMEADAKAGRLEIALATSTRGYQSRTL